MRATDTLERADAPHPHAGGVPTGGRPLLTIAALRKTFPAATRAGQALVALDHIDLAIHAHEFVSLLGPSGCGKSTLLQIVAGLQDASAGAVRLEGALVTEPPEGMVYLFQQYSKSLLPWRNVLDNVAFPLESQPGLRRAEIVSRARELLAKVGLAGFERHFPWQLSGGMQQRAAIARALAARPRILLLDEPLSAVDALTRVELQMLLLDIWRSEQLTILLVTHDVDEAIFLSDRVAVLSRQPTRVEDIFETGLPRPRDSIRTREDERFLSLRRHLLHRLLSGAPR